MKNTNRKYKEVKGRLLEFISAAGFGDRVPGERELAREFGYSYMTIRRAVDELVREGFLYREPRKGTFVAAPAKKKDKSGNIGFFLYDKLKDGIASPYYSLLFSSLQDELSAHGYNLFFFTNPSTISVDGVDGIITTPFPEIEDQITELSRILPVVLYDNRIPAVDLPTVSIDNFNSLYHMTEYAISLGHREIGYLTGELNSSIGLKRLAGFKTALENYNVNHREDFIIHGNYQFESGYESAEHYLRMAPRPTFIVCANDLMAVGLLKGLSEKGVRVPEDINISGFDNIVLSSKIHPGITTMAIDFKQVADSLITLLLDRIEDKQKEPQSIILQTTLIERESTSEFILSAV